MAAEQKYNQYVSYPIFKGLQKPLEFMGVQGRYITWAACAIGGAILGFIIVYCIVGFLAGLIVLAVSLIHVNVSFLPSNNINNRYLYFGLNTFF